jgi:serine protease inhibitor
VEKRTKDRIKDLIAADMLSDQVKMVLINAIYFKGPYFCFKR